jgi:hypothetical protein
MTNKLKMMLETCDITQNSYMADGSYTVAQNCYTVTESQCMIHILIHCLKGGGDGSEFLYSRSKSSQNTESCC